MEPTVISAAPDREAIIRRLRWLLWAGIVLLLAGIVVLIATVVLHIEHRNAGPNPFLLVCLRLRFYLAHLGGGIALTSVLGLIGLRAWHFSLRSLMIWTAIAGLLLGSAARIVRSHNNEIEHLNLVIHEGGLSAKYGFSDEKGSGSMGIRLLFYGWNEISSWHYWTMVSFVALPLLIKWPVYRRYIVRPEIQTNIP